MMSNDEKLKSYEKSLRIKQLEGVVSSLSHLVKTLEDRVEKLIFGLDEIRCELRDLHMDVHPDWYM